MKKLNDYYFYLLKYLMYPFSFSVMLLINSVLTFFLSIYFWLHELVIFIEWDILMNSSVNLILTFLLDWMSLSFLATVSFISSMVFYYSYYYMMWDKKINRFMILVFLFVISMILLILSPNLVSILLGWDGLGLVSYCLVIYYQNEKSANAGMLTILSNRIGDIAILLGIAWLFNFGGWNFFYFQYLFSLEELFLILFLVMLAAMTKSAQIPFSAWLPAAMAAPTPVSSLVHSSTLVTAGVYLLIRFNELIGVNIYLLFISTMTMLMSGLGANYETDLKKIIALSTLSQLGVMTMTISLGMSELAYFHLVSHALFKSLLFLCAGGFIHFNEDNQDIRLLGGLSLSFPIMSMMFIGCSLSLCGFPFLAGFYSKDLILECFFMENMNMLMLLMIYLSTLLTMTYSVRLAGFMMKKTIGASTVIFQEMDLSMLFPMMFLFLNSLLVGSWFSWIFIPSISIILPDLLKLLMLLSGLLILPMVWQYFFSFHLIFLKNFFSLKIKMIWFMGMMWFMPLICTTLNQPNFKLGYLIFKYFDHGWMENFGGQSIMLKLMSQSSFQDSWIWLNFKSYMFMIFIFSTFMMLI